MRTCLLIRRMRALMTAAVDNTWQTCIMCASQKEQLLYRYECVRAARTIKVHVCGCSVCANKPQAHCVLRAASRQELRCRCRVAALPPDCSRQFICIYGIRNTELLIHGRVSTKTKTPAAVAPLPTAGAKKQKRELELNE